MAEAGNRRGRSPEIEKSEEGFLSFSIASDLVQSLKVFGFEDILRALGLLQGLTAENYQESMRAL